MYINFKKIAELSSNSKVYVDLNEVLADIWGAVSKQPINTRERIQMMKENSSPEELASKIQWTPGGKELWAGISKYHPTILSSSRKPDVNVPDEAKFTLYLRKAKDTWVANNLPGVGEVIHVEGPKVVYAANGDTSNILTDLTV